MQQQQQRKRSQKKRQQQQQQQQQRHGGDGGGVRNSSTDSGALCAREHELPLQSPGSRSGPKRGPIENTHGASILLAWANSTQPCPRANSSGRGNLCGRHVLLPSDTRSPHNMPRACSCGRGRGVYGVQGKRRWPRPPATERIISRLLLIFITAWSALLT